ncbi:hydroxylamine reductase [Thiofilum flexile]|uniref:hydroxylamine reductase n=1 Tax=Thiofilum flexile TaxID=125627 RepID=UPI000374C081|nr:hydroxylamine reductase [Thiofilum flexile]
MFCYQCEQTQRSDTVLGCASQKGNCGKDTNTSDLQDILIYQLIGLADYAQHARTVGITDQGIDDFIQYGMFTTLTNVNFNATRFVNLIQQAAKLRDTLKAQLATTPLANHTWVAAASFAPTSTMEELLKQHPIAAINRDQAEVGADVIGLRMLILYGLKGVCAYSHHARTLGFRDSAIDADIAKLLAYLGTDPVDMDELLAQSLAVGEVNLRVMELLDRANNETFGNQTVTQVRVSPVAGKAILVSGHDLHDLAQILEQTKDSGVNVYTHGEMLPAHAYPGLKRYPHLVGNYGSAWQNQQIEFAEFPGPIILTSNCIIEPDKSYKQRIFTVGPVGWAGVRHIDNGDYKMAIQAAKALPGFKESAPEKFITTGFGHHTVLGVADKVVAGVKAGAIQHFFVIGGCDGAKPGRNYYTELAQSTPANSVVLTLGCAKYRFNQHEFGAIDGIPRLLDLGQCNDAYSAIKIASTLAGAFGCSVNELPLSLMISWFEQKATAVLLSLLAVGVKGIHLGPTLPVYLTPNLLAVLQERFDIRVNNTPEADLKLALATAA